MCAPNRSVKFHLVLFIWQHFTKTAPTINKDSEEEPRRREQFANRLQTLKVVLKKQKVFFNLKYNKVIEGNKYPY